MQLNGKRRRLKKIRTSPILRPMDLQTSSKWMSRERYCKTHSIIKLCIFLVLFFFCFLLCSSTSCLIFFSFQFCLAQVDSCFSAGGTSAVDKPFQVAVNGVKPVSPEQEELIHRLVYFQNEFEHPSDEELRRVNVSS